VGWGRVGGVGWGACGGGVQAGRCQAREPGEVPGGLAHLESLGGEAALAAAVTVIARRRCAWRAAGAGEAGWLPSLPRAAAATRGLCDRRPLVLQQPF
jgi:hypothetical protein